MEPSNKAAWILKVKGNPFIIDDAPLPRAGPNEVVVKNHAVAINPIEWKIQDWGIFLKHYPNILGADVAGEIFEVGPGVTHVQKGDRVIGHAFSLVTNNPLHGGFQNYTTLNALVVSKIPPSLPYTLGSTLPLSISTAAACLYKKEALALPFPSLNPETTNKSILIWGGSSSVGASAIQLALASGVHVITTASQRNISKVSELGNAENLKVFDYKLPTVTDSIITHLRASNTEFEGICDCIGTAPAIMAWAPVYKEFGGKYGTVLPPTPDLPGEMRGTNVFAPSIAFTDQAVGLAVWKRYLPEALEKGVFKVALEVVVLKGLDKVQKGVDMVRGGVSFEKVVVEVWDEGEDELGVGDEEEDRAEPVD